MFIRSVIRTRTSISWWLEKKTTMLVNVIWSYVSNRKQNRCDGWLWESFIFWWYCCSYISCFTNQSITKIKNSLQTRTSDVFFIFKFVFELFCKHWYKFLISPNNNNNNNLKIVCLFQNCIFELLFTDGRRTTIDLEDFDTIDFRNCGKNLYCYVMFWCLLGGDGIFRCVVIWFDLIWFKLVSLKKQPWIFVLFFKFHKIKIVWRWLVGIHRSTYCTGQLFFVKQHFSIRSFCVFEDCFFCVHNWLWNSAFNTTKYVFNVVDRRKIYGHHQFGLITIFLALLLHLA